MSLDSDEDDFVEYGNPVEQFDEETLPRKKATSIQDQIATDEHGRRRFHGAFTGGFSAGFFNSVGSLEGWTPSTFKSSRSDKAKAKIQNAEDFMDEEDMDEFGIAPKVLHATNDFNSGLKRKKIHQLSDGPIPGVPVLSELLQAAKDTVGIKLLKKMGWKPGQGIGPRVTKAEKKKMKEEYKKTKRKIYGCSLPQEMSKVEQSDSDENNSTDDENYENVTFAPEDFQPSFCKSKDNYFGLGFSGLDRRPVLSTHINLFEPVSLKTKENKKKFLIAGQAFGVGAFEEEDEDIYSREDMSQYDFSLESTSTTSKQKSQGVLPNYSGDILEGFVLGVICKTFKKHFPPPLLPQDFQPKHQPRKTRFDDSGVSNVKMKESIDAKKRGLQRHNITAEERATILGDSPPTNVITSIKVESNGSSNVVTKVTDTLAVPTKLGVSNFKPFAADPDKEKRYEQYLDLLKNGQKERFSYYQPLNMTEWEREREKVEFERSAALYKPLSGMMSDRFVSASQPEDLNSPLPSLSKPIDEDADKKAAAKMKMFGRLTREEIDWRPCSLLCKRFNVPELFPGTGESSNVKKKPSSKFSVFSYLDTASFNKMLGAPSETQPDSETVPTLEAPDTNIKEEQLPTEESEDISDKSSSEQKTKSLEIEFPDPPAKVDLFKAIFLSSSESDSENDDVENQVKVVPQESKGTDLKTDDNLEEESSTPKNILRNLSPPRGVFANLDLDAINMYQRDKVTSPKGSCDDNEVPRKPELSNNTNEQQTQDSDMYGPVLPTLNSVISKSCAPVSSSTKLLSVVASGSCEWVEKTKSSVPQEKHKKHKKSSKPKKHKKSKHKKKKH